MKFRPVIAGITLSLVCAISASIFAFGKQSSPSMNLITFEGMGSGTFNSQQTQFSFSVRCYGVNCAGAIVFGSPSATITSGGAVNYVTGTVSEVQPETYLMSLSTPQAPAGTLPPTTAPIISCSLMNSAPVTQGQTNLVSMNCSSPSGTGASQNAVVLSSTASSN